MMSSKMLNKLEYNEFSGPAKSPEEIKQMETPEDLDEIERSKLLLTKKSQVQQIAILTNLHFLFRDVPASQEHLLPIVLKNVLTWSEELQIEAGRALSKILDSDLLDKANLEAVFEITVQMLKIWSQKVLQEWVGVFKSLVRHLSSARLLEAIELSLTLSDTSQPLASRSAAAHLMGMLAQKVDNKTFEAKLLAKVKRLC